MISSVAVKKTASTAIKQNATAGILAGAAFVLVCTIGVLLLSIISSVSGIAGAIFAFAFIMFVCYPTFLGALRFFRRMIWGECDSLVSVFYYFSSRNAYKSAITLSGALAIRLAGGFLALNIPAFAVSAAASHKFYELLNLPTPVWTSYVWPILAFLRCSAAILLFIYLLKFYMAPFLFVSTDKTAEECILLSCRVSRRSASDFFWLLVSMFGWIIISVFLIPLIFTLPYFIAAYIVHCRFAVAQYNKTVDSMKVAPPTFNADESI